MARKKSGSGHSAARDLAGFLIFISSIFLLIALISYDQRDPSFHTSSFSKDGIIRNWGGILGSYLSDMLIQWLGYLSILTVLAGLGIAYAVTFRKFELVEKGHMAGGLLVLAGLFLLLGFGKATDHTMLSWSGALGYFFNQGVQTYLGIVGTILLVPCLVFAGLYILIRFSVRSLGVWTWNTAKPWLVLPSLKSSKNVMAAEKPLKAKRAGVIAEIEVEGEEEDEVQEETEPVISERPAKRNYQDIPITFNAMKNKPPPSAPAFHAQESETWEPPQTNYELPSIQLLQEPKHSGIAIDKDELLDRARILEEKLKDFGVLGKVVGVQPGPVVTMYEFEPAPGVKVNQVTRLNDDLALALRALSVRITLLPGKSVVGIEVANQNREIVFFQEVVDDKSFSANPSLLSLALGKDISGTPYTTDLRKMPHLLIAGATGSGKSVAINSIILSILYKATPDQVRMILVDPKMLELNLYENIPHLLLPVVTDPKKAAAALRWAVSEMERRYRLMADYGVRNIEGYNRKATSGEAAKEPKVQAELPTEPAVQHEGAMPYIMIVIDELADLMMVSSREVEDSIIRLAQMARASGIHLLLATQRPSVDVITGVIKANMPARISFQVSSKIDSRTILDANGAESLLGAGDMLFLPPGSSKLMRIHGAFVSDLDVQKVTDHWKTQGKPQFKEEILKDTEIDEALANSGDPDDDLYRQALQIVRTSKIASISLIQRKLRIGYNRAARIVERMEEDGLLAPGEVGKPREVLMSRLSG